MNRFAFLMIFICLFSFSLSGDLKVKKFTGLPFIKRDFEQLYLGKNAGIQVNDVIHSNGGTLFLSSDLWELTLGKNSRAKWRNEGKVWSLDLMEGSAVVKKVSARKAFLELKTPQLQSKGEIQEVLIYTNLELSKLWLSKGEMKFQSYHEHLKLPGLTKKIAESTLLEYHKGSTVVHTRSVNNDILDQFELELLENKHESLKDHSAINHEKMNLIARSIKRRKENRNYFRGQRSELIESIYEAVLEDTSFTFSFPISPPPN